MNYKEIINKEYPKIRLIDNLISPIQPTKFNINIDFSSVVSISNVSYYKNQGDWLTFQILFNGSMNGSNSFAGTGYFNTKVRTSKSDYFDRPEKWQVGDVIAVDYTGGKPYGHIQVWTGVKWMSDFTQNRLQISNVDWNSVALHRMNDKGVAAVKKQSASSIHIFSYYGDKGTNIQTSRAYSVSEELVEEKNGLFQLFYIFTNEPETLLTQLNNHAGTAKFKYYPDIKTLDGDYYNQRNYKYNG
jgi:hypothetical protein